MSKIRTFYIILHPQKVDTSRLKLLEKIFHKIWGGFTHSSLVEHKTDYFISVNPLLIGAQIEAGFDVVVPENSRVYQIKVRKPKIRPAFMGLRFLTCATFIQWCMGIKLDAILSRTLEKNLLEMPAIELNRRGVLLVKTVSNGGDAWVLRL